MLIRDIHTLERSDRIYRSDPYRKPGPPDYQAIPIVINTESQIAYVGIGRQ
ncbi:MAG TPA: hypothetical protein VK436_12000 [Methanocella sp.]|nr:hypothetical protein [Methanocella sp.]